MRSVLCETERAGSADAVGPASYDSDLTLEQLTHLHLPLCSDDCAFQRAKCRRLIDSSASNVGQSPAKTMRPVSITQTRLVQRRANQMFCSLSSSDVPLVSQTFTTSHANC